MLGSAGGYKNPLPDTTQVRSARQPAGNRAVTYDQIRALAQTKTPILAEEAGRRLDAMPRPLNPEEEVEAERLRELEHSELSPCWLGTL